jgi:cysteinyl-tRNA synthetase
VASRVLDERRDTSESIGECVLSAQRFLRLTGERGQPFRVGQARQLRLERFRLAGAVEKGGPDAALAAAVERLRRDFAAALADDLNAAAALAALFLFVKEVNVAVEEERLGGGDRDRVLAALADVDRVLGVLDPAAWPPPQSPGAAEADGEEIERLIHQRNEARRTRDFKTSDRIRDELAGRGIVLEDTPQGPRWRKL